MNHSKLILLFLLLPALVLGQAKTFEVFGTVTGKCKERIYLFYEGNLVQKDSISAPVKEGKFYFKLKATLPILCRLHFGEQSNVQELYVDGSKTQISLSSTLTEENTPDSLGGARVWFELTSVKGSKTEALKRSFEAWKQQLNKSNLTEEQKHSEHFARLESLVTNHPKSKASAYLIAGRIYLMGQAFMFMGKFPFSYSEVHQLASLLDTSLYQTLEWQNLSGLLNRLDLERNRATGTAFHDVVLQDTTGSEVDTKNYRNKYVLVDFWASWCKPCRALQPELKVLYEKYRGKSFEIIGVSLDTDKEDWKKAIRQDGLPWVELIDEKAFKGELAKHYDIYGVPVKTLLDREGKVIGFDLSIAEIEDILKAL